MKNLSDFWRMNGVVKITIAAEEDYNVVAEIGRETFYETWRPVNTEEDMQLYLAESFNPEKIKKDIADTSVNTFLIAYYNDKVIGYAKLRNDRMYDEFKGSPALEMERIYVLADYQRHKVGKALMDESLRLAKEGNYEWFWLGVNDENYKAVNFYKQYGFTVFGTKSFKLGNAIDSDLLMKLRLEPQHYN